MRPTATLMAAIMTLMLAAADATAARRVVPRGFFGANWNFEIRDAAPTVQTLTWNRMATAGVEAQRAAFFWAAAQPSPNGPFSFADTDAIVQHSAWNRISLLPVVELAPRWARQSDAGAA